LPSRYDLQSLFEADGILWPATDPSRVFSAHLISGKKRIEISRAAEIGGPEQFLADDDLGTSVLHGSTTLGPCTLIGLQNLSAPKYLDGPTGQVILAPRFRVSACLLGMHVADENAPIMTSGTFSYAGLGDWLRPSTQTRLNEAVLISHPIPTPSLLDFFVGAIKARIILRVVSRLQFSPSGRHSASRDEPQVSIRPSEPVSLAWLIDTAKRFENFLSLCLGTSARLR